VLLAHSLRPSARGCVENSVTTGRDMRALGSRWVSGAGRRRGRRNGLHEEGPQRVLEGGDRAVGVREGVLEMGEDLGRRRMSRGLRRQRSWLGRWAAAKQCRADGALGLVEAFADTPQGSVTPMAVGSADGGVNAVANGALEEAPQSAGSQAQASDFVRGPDAEGPSAPASAMAVAAKEAACA
jgi:hypothetical protein